jgi:hypothetical protein
MNDDLKIYKAKKSNMSGGVFVLALIFLGFTLPAIIVGELPLQRELIGQGIFYLCGIVLLIAPLGSRLEVGKDYVKWRFFSVCTGSLRASDIEEIHYTKIIRWGVVGMGNGLAGWVKTKHGQRYFSFSETGYGKEAIMHAKRVLEQYIRHS